MVRRVRRDRRMASPAVRRSPHDVGRWPRWRRRTRSPSTRRGRPAPARRRRSRRHRFAWRLHPTVLLEAAGSALSLSSEAPQRQCRRCRRYGRPRRLASRLSPVNRNGSAPGPRSSVMACAEVVSLTVSATTSTGAELAVPSPRAPLSDRALRPASPQPRPASAARSATSPP